MNQENIILELRSGGLMSTREIARRCGASQSMVVRVLRESAIAVPVGRGRGARYGLLHTIGNHGHTWPVHRILEDGSRELLGRITALEGDRWLVEFEKEETLFETGLRNGVSEGWPWFLDELRPQGFMGRAFARKYHRFLGSSNDLNQWGSDQFLLAAYLFGDDLPGNLMIGDHELTTPANHSTRNWPELAREAVSGEPVGSSAAGERPKFTNGNEIVKFALRDNRWADLLIAEHLAAETLNDNDIAAVSSRIVEEGDYLFLSVRRFDRTNFGRRPMHSLEAIDGALYGEGKVPYGMMGEHLFRDGLVDSNTSHTLGEIAEFGRLIGNTDMHLGNVSFIPNHENIFELAPVYDMLPMRYAPTEAGVPEPQPSVHSIPRRSSASIMARTFWERVETDERIHQDFQDIARLNLRIYPEDLGFH